MTTRVKDTVQVDTSVFSKSKNMIVNGVMEMMLEVIYERKLDPNKIISSRKVIEDGMYVWLHERTLESITLEVSLPRSSSAMERWDFEFQYKDTPDSQVHTVPSDEMGRFCRALKSLPAGSTYRIVAIVAPGAKEVTGWEPTTFKDFNPTAQTHFDGFGYGNIFGQAFYQGGTW